MDRIVRAAEMPRGKPRLPPPQVEDPFALVIFGARGNLASTKLFPALWRLWQQKFFRAPWIILGVGRARRSDEQFRQEMRDRLAEQLGEAELNVWPRFAGSVFYQPADATRREDYRPLAER